MVLRGCADGFGRDEDAVVLDWQGGRRIGTGGAGEEDNAVRRDSAVSAVGHDPVARSLKDISRHYDDVVALGAALPAVRVAVGEARGLVLAEDATARFAIPPFTNSAMDGFAVRRADVTVGEPLPVAGDIPAGCTDIPELHPGTTLRIMTGAPLPTGADAILQVELTENASTNMLPAAPAEIVPTAIPGTGEHIRYAGEDIEAGALAFAAGTVLTPAHLAALVALGHADVVVHARPRVGVVTTGDELRAPGEDLAPGQIPDSNSMLVTQLAVEAGGTSEPFACHTDTIDSFLAGLRMLADGVDLIVTTGGVSAGAFDVVKAALLSEGVVFDKVAMQPGKPQGFGTVADSTGRLVPIICLPGNPVSVFVSWQLFGRPLLDSLFGRPVPEYEDLFWPDIAGVSWSRKAGRTQFLPCVRVGAGARGPAGAAMGVWVCGDASDGGLAGDRNDDGAAGDGSRGTAAGDAAGDGIDSAAGVRSVMGVGPATAGGSKSHLIAALPLATGLARVPAEVADVHEGDPVDVMWFR
ncbi:MAG: molybdopterin molybdotransferase MoeA [Ancrocorticia sp.]